MANFNATELQDAIRHIDTLCNGFIYLAKAGSCDNEGENGSENIMHDLIVSEDSNLAATWKNAAETTMAIAEKARQLTARIRVEIDKYVKQTIENEEKAAAEVKSISDSLQNNKAALDQINI